MAVETDRRLIESAIALAQGLLTTHKGLPYNPSICSELEENNTYSISKPPLRLSNTYTHKRIRFYPITRHFRWPYLNPRWPMWGSDHRGEKCWPTWTRMYNILTVLKHIFVKYTWVSTHIFVFVFKCGPGTIPMTCFLFRHGQRHKNITTARFLGWQCPGQIL